MVVAENASRRQAASGVIGFRDADDHTSDGFAHLFIHKSANPYVTRLGGQLVAPVAAAVDGSRLRATGLCEIRQVSGNP